MAKHGFQKDGSRVGKKQKVEEDDRQSIVKALKRQEQAQSTTFNLLDWQSVFTAWAVIDDVSLGKTTSNALKQLLIYRNPIIEGALPQSYSTTRSWIMQGFKQAKAAVRRSMATSKSRITLSFDGWKSGNELDLLGVVAHYIDEQYQVKNVLLALRNTYGSHKGVEIHHHLLAVCREFKIGNRLAFFMADNASNNDLALQLLQNDLNIDPHTDRLRCAGHIINLVCKAILFGTDIDCIDEVLFSTISEEHTTIEDAVVSQFERELRSRDELSVIKAWRKKGPVGKLHNLIVHIRATPLRREFFKQKQKEATADCKRLYSVVLNGGIRWNSTFDMIDRAIKLRDAIELYQLYFKDDEDEPTAADLLTSSDWLELIDLHSLLKPLKQASLSVQSDGKDCHHGSLFESLQTIDWLLTKLEGLKRQHEHLPTSHFKASINLGWKKLNKYYELSDLTPHYRAAIAIHPHFKMRWFQKQWQQHHPQWIAEALTAIEELFDGYKRRHSDEAAALRTPALEIQELSELDQYNTMGEEFEGDELQRFLHEDIAPQGTNPLSWWQSNQERFPVLRHMAFDLLAAPASSSADERAFSMAGHVLDKEHYSTLDDLAEAHQCLKSAHREGIIKRVAVEPSDTLDTTEQAPTSSPTSITSS
jgi:hypothetical protein